MANTPISGEAGEGVPASRGKVRSAALGALATIIVTVGGSAAARAADLVAYTGPWPPWSSKKIAITTPDGPVPQCAIIKGSGSAPTGKTIWVAERAQGDDGYFGLKPADADPSGGWRVTMDLGADGIQFDVFAFPLDEESTRLLHSIRAKASVGKPADQDKAYWYLQNLPVGDPAFRTIPRDAKDKTPCQQ